MAKKIAPDLRPERVALRAQMTIYFRVPARSRLVDIAMVWNDAIAWLGRERFHWVQKRNEATFDRLQPAAWAKLGERFAKTGSVYIHVKGATSADDVADTSVDLIVHPRGSMLYQGTLSMLRVIAPVAEMDDAWRDRFVDLCTRLPEAHGLAGHLLAVADTTMPLPVREATHAAMIASVTKQPGVDLAFDQPNTLARTKTIHGIGWLTAINEAQRARVRVPKPITALPAGTSMVVQAGERPETGDGGKLPPSYVRVLAALQPVIAPYRAYP